MMGRTGGINNGYDGTIAMQFYFHIGATLDGRAESNKALDRWIHQTPLVERLEAYNVAVGNDRTPLPNVHDEQTAAK